MRIMRNILLIIVAVCLMLSLCSCALIDLLGGISLLNSIVATEDDNGKWGYVNIIGEYVIESQFDEAYDFDGEVAVVKVDEKWGYINKKGEYIIEPQFDENGNVVLEDA